jgi:hypothetical protein
MKGELPGFLISTLPLYQREVKLDLGIVVDWNARILAAHRYCLNFIVAKTEKPRRFNGEDLRSAKSL